MTLRRREWLSALALGLWLSVASVWPVAMMPLGRTQLLWQPFLLLSLVALTAVRARQVGWAAAAGQGVYLFMFFTLTGWLPWLRAIPSSLDFQYPPAYRHYLALYEAALSALVGFQAACAASGCAPRWWPVGSWSRPLVVAPLWLIGRAVFFEHWVSPLMGVVVGWMLWALQPWRRALVQRSALRGWQLIPWGLFAFTLLVVFGGGMRIYGKLRADFLLASDDGINFYDSAVEIAQDPSRIWSYPAIERNMFTGYFVFMGLWFRAVGPHIPSWLLWQGVAAGLLAVVVYRLGQVVGSRAVGAVAAVLVVLDHVMLHLMATFNMEVGLIPSLYAAVWLWVSADAHPPHVRLRRSFWAGLMFGVATLFRPTAGLLPLLLVVLLVWERPRLSWRHLRVQAAVMFAGFALPLLLLLIRHRIAWGQWTLGGERTLGTSWKLNYAWTIQDQHPAKIGLGPWLKLFAEDPSVLWREIIPAWWAQLLQLWTHPGFGQMDLVQGLNYPGFYQAGLATILVVAVVVGAIVAARRRRRVDLTTLALPAYFTSLILVFLVLNTRYRAPFIPAVYLLGCLGVSAIAAAIRSRVMISPALSMPVHSRSPTLRGLIRTPR
ncbi:MAG: glycosyltransferase family 39 protein [Candidatus Omnitrophica bacterium]|nr:glycosyltransferase family 39 protein [Candidatus Omnitrophota bacterium]